MKRSPSLKMMLCWILQKFPSILILESNLLSYSLTKAVFNLFLCCAVLCVVAQSCPTLCHLMDCSLPGSSVHGIVQARILEWVAMPSSRESSQIRDWTRFLALQADSWLSHHGNPRIQAWVALLTQELNRGLLHCRLILYQQSYQGICYLNYSYNECQITIWRDRQEYIWCEVLYVITLQIVC